MKNILRLSSISLPATNPSFLNFHFSFISVFTNSRRIMTTTNLSTSSSSLHTSSNTPSGMTPSGLHSLNFTDSFIRLLPEDSETKDKPPEQLTDELVRSSRLVRKGLYSRLPPQPCTNPYLLLVSNEVGQNLLDLKPEELYSKEFLDYFSGNLSLPGRPTGWALNYSGYQFGVWAGQLGDGRAVTLGEVTNNRKERWEVQLKGCGLTPYSRFADGRAVLRSSLREFLCSEAMHHLGIPTSRCLSLIGTHDAILRERVEPGAVVSRLAPSWIRFGSFENLYDRQMWKELQQLADFILDTHFEPPNDSSNSKEMNQDHQRYARFFREVVRRTAYLIAHWQAAGFCHGVMNTDNMSILGLTIDYGPFAFLDDYDPAWICNHSDSNGRYAFNRQPEIAYWNLEKLGDALQSLLNDEEVDDALNNYYPLFNEYYNQLMIKKLGLLKLNIRDREELINPLLSMMEKAHADYTAFFRALCDFDPSTELSIQKTLEILLKTANTSKNASSSATSTSSTPESCDPEQIKKAIEPEWKLWTKQYSERIQLELKEHDSLEERKARMKKSNPKYILRNYLAELAIHDAESKVQYLQLNGKIFPYHKPTPSELSSPYFAQILFLAITNPYEDHIPGVVDDIFSPSVLPQGWKGIQCSCSS